MHQSEAQLLEPCWMCGAEIQVDRDRGYLFGPDIALCYACAVLRGGVYEVLEDRWVVPPDPTGLPDEMAEAGQDAR